MRSAQQHATPGAKTLMIPVSRSKVVVRMVGAGAFTAVGVVMMPRTWATGDATADTMQILVIVFCGALTLYAMYLLTFAPPALMVTQEGIRVCQLKPLGIHLIPWSAIEEFVVIRTRFQTLLGVKLSNPRTLLDGKNIVQRLLIHLLLSQLSNSGIIVTGDGLLPMSIGDLLAHMRRQFHHEISQHAIQFDRRK